MISLKLKYLVLIFSILYIKKTYLYAFFKNTRNKQKIHNFYRFFEFEHTAILFSKYNIDFDNDNDKINSKKQNHRKSASLNDRVTYFKQNHVKQTRFLTLQYDHLAMSALEAIQVLPIIQFRKGKSYLNKWWTNAKKWNLLSGELKELDDKLNQLYSDSNDNTNDIDNNNNMIYNIVNYDDSDDNNIESNNGDEYDDITSDEVDQSEEYEENADLESDIDYSNESFRDIEEEENMELDNEDVDEENQDYQDDHLVDDNYESQELGFDEISSSEIVTESESEPEPEPDDFPDNELISNKTISKRVYIPRSYNDTIKSSKYSNKISSNYSRFNNIIPYGELYRMSRDYQARVICISDVHGCIDDLCALLRHVNYRPGDQIVLLGDLVAKGPKSAEVVKFGRENNVLCIRGNHDHEVIQQGIKYYSKKKVRKIKSRSEHVQVAMDLSIKDLQWLSKSPFYARSPDLGALFVHAGFQPNLRFADQNPLIMMTIRSLLPGNKYSAKCFYEFPWASKWRGPLTVYFGHDAARGLQIYDNAVGLDTGCVYGGNLTAVILPDKQIVSLKATHAYRQLRESKSHRKLLSSKGKNEDSVELENF